ncbi:unnamed protein product [Parascedosporium putredinis]|uniref:Mid2 domain-containing protein n=1 Tax=Parascedosporium putredinis TaxID=1442378 RepID=A0A9P1H5Q3_9PEZI|nr:unnamed protein product [Parascedosporium putredinis]CAI7997989.1 unnamed protein product [Parascedosporium putredinis]
MRLQLSLRLIATAAFGALMFPAIVHPWPTSDLTTELHDPSLIEDISFVLLEPWPASNGLEPQYGHQTLWLRKRECLENGSNYCFAEKERFCPDCGGCCSLGSDRVTVTSTKTVQTTMTHSEVEVVTVHVQVEATSTLNSLVTITITSDQGTQTEVTLRPGGNEELSLWGFRGAVEETRFRRPAAPPRDPVLPISPTESSQCTTLTSADAFELLRRQNDGGTSTSTVFVTTTVVARTTVKDRKTTTNFETTTITTTIFYTSTKVLGARETVFSTSTVTVSSRQPTTRTITSTSTSFYDPTDMPQTGILPTETPGLQPDTETRSRSRLSTGAIAGIGVGSGIAALAIGVLAFFLWRRSKNKKEPQGEFPPDFILAPAPAPIPSSSRHHRGSYISSTGGKSSRQSYGGTAAATGSPPGTRDHNRSISEATTHVPSAYSSVAHDMPYEQGERPQMRTIPHPSTSTVGRMTRFAELDG